MTEPTLGVSGGSPLDSAVRRVPHVVDGTSGAALSFRSLITDHAPDFFELDWGKRVLLLEGPADRFEELFGWDALDSILEFHQFSSPRLRMAHESGFRELPAISRDVIDSTGRSQSMLDLGALGSNLRRGATLVVDAIDEVDASVRLLAEDFQRVLGERVRVNLYASFGTESGFGTHWDDHDVLALQIAGQKKWSMFGPTRVDPLRRDIGQNEVPPESDGVHFDLCAGQALYVPAGFWHSATANNSPSLHLTFGYSPRTGIDALTWLVEQLRSEPSLRRRLPRHSTEDVQQVAGRHVLEACLDYMDRPDFLAQYLSAVSSTRLMRPRVNTLAAAGQVDLLAGDTSVRLLAPEPVAIETVDGHVELRVAGKLIRFPAALHAWAERLSAGHPIRVQECLSLARLEGVDDAYVVTILDSLVASGLLDVRTHRP